ncbi:hypothetical protein H6P81_007131 [Aristolochia fimbriata]|uniref:Uncharacterized protein n=1 Tax=Aristolochia fimbriata TaxID=158543 RepID=A0AAV7F2P7_ARIFI|nr:hypothetical protein H6P81_007131 [Aristolochia fimbriata]
MVVLSLLLSKPNSGADPLVMLISSSLLTHLVFLTSGTPLYSCPLAGGNYTANSNFATNLDLLLSSLVSKASSSGYGNDSRGSGGDEVYGSGALSDQPSRRRMVRAVPFALLQPEFILEVGRFFQIPVHEYQECIGPGSVLHGADRDDERPCFGRGCRSTQVRHQSSPSRCVLKHIWPRSVQPHPLRSELLQMSPETNFGPEDLLRG